jgi:hypothetical protein
MAVFCCNQFKNTVSVHAIGVKARVKDVLEPFIAPDGVSLIEKLPLVNQLIESGVNTNEVLHRVILSVTSFHPVSAFTVPCEI